MVAPALALHSAPARVVIVDDHPNTAAMLARTLGEFSRPVDIITARSGQEALDRLGNAAVDVLITDFMMPNMNGLELIEKLNASSGDALRAAHTILITAYDSPGLALTARRLKVNDYLVKPVQPEKIRDIVSRVLEGLTPLKPPVTEPAAGTQFKLLIADDQPDNIRVLTKHLEPEGYAFVTAGDGEEALQKVRAELPDLVLLDVNMPRKNGFEVLTEIRADAKVAHIPVVMITASRVEPRDIRTGLGLGADDYVTKPFDWRELAARVRAKLRVKQVEDALRRRNHELGLLPEIGQDLSARLDVEELADVVLQRTVVTLGASMGHLAVFHPDGGVLHKTHVEGGPGPLNGNAQRAEPRMVAEGLIAYVTAARRGTIVEDADTDPRWLKMPDDPVRSAVAVPLLSRRGVIGVLTLSHDRPAYFNSDHLTLLQAIASQAAIAIENAQLYAVELKRVNELVALNQLTRDLSLYTRSAELFERAPHLIRDSLGYAMVSLWLTDAERSPGAPLLRSVAGAENGPPQSVWALAPRRVAATGRPAVLSATADDLVAKGAPEGGTVPQRPPVQSAVAVPLFWEAKVSGVLCVHSARANAFQESDRVLLETLAAQIAAALERIRLFESVEQEEQRLAAVLRGAADAILVLDSEGRLRLVNPAGQELFTDVDASRLLDQPLPASRGYDGLIDLVGRARRLGVPLQGEIPWPDKRTFAVLITPIEDGGQVAVLNDVTRFKDLERVKNEFIATASHDLKNPINALLGYGDLLLRAGPLNERQTDYAERMRQAATQMHDLVLNLVELAGIDLGVDLKLKVCDVLDLLTSVTDEFRAQGGAKNLTLTLERPGGRPCVRGDPTRLRQVVRNLVGNAVKYTPAGGRVTVSAVTEDSVAQVQIRDTGIGIPPADLPFVFDKFYRAQTEGTRGIEGNGLGLAIVKSIVEQHGGQVAAESKLGQGSCFSIRLPLALAAHPAPMTIRAYALQGIG